MPQFPLVDDNEYTLLKKICQNTAEVAGSVSIEEVAGLRAELDAILAAIEELT